MVGSGSYARDDGVDGKVLLSDVALLLYVPRPSSLSRPFITGRLAGADFGVVTLFAYAAADDYAYAADTAFSCPPPSTPARDGRHVFDGGFSCPHLRALLRGSYSLDYGRAASRAAPLRRMHVNRMSCAADGSVRAYIAFYADRPESFPSNHSVWWREDSSVFLVGDEALVLDGFWDASRSQLCMRACRVARADVAVRECGVRVSFWFPGVWSFRDRRAAAGLIWNASDGDADGKTSSGVIAVSRTVRHTYTGDLSDIKYNYTRVEEATRHFDHSKPVLSRETKAGRFPVLGPLSSYSLRDFRFRFSSLKKQRLSGDAWPVTIGSALLEGDWRMTEDEFSRRVAAEVNNRSLLSVSYHLKYQVRGVNSHANMSPAETPQERRIIAEGVYDTQTGHMCMLGCQQMNCEVLVTVQFAPIEAESRDRAVGTISSLRNQSDPLFFKALDFIGGGMYRVQVVDLASRMDVEGVMMVVTAVVSRVLTALQLRHAKKHRDALPAMSVTMLVVLATGNLVPLLFNFESAVLAWHDLFYQLHLSRTSNFALRASTILAFVLLLRLMQLTLSRRRSAEARRDDGSASPSAAAERNTVRVCLAPYFIGAVLLLFAKTGDGRGQRLINATGPKLAEALAYYGGLILFMRRSRLVSHNMKYSVYCNTASRVPGHHKPSECSFFFFEIRQERCHSLR
ncbi:hypothetical protein EJB05_16064, partial [Eragrostis curvula]